MGKLIIIRLVLITIINNSNNEPLKKTKTARAANELNWLHNDTQTIILDFTIMACCVIDNTLHVVIVTHMNG